MARYDSSHKEQTRRRIVDVAAQRLKRDGIAASGIASLMADSNLTNGAFYAHFASKDDLVTTVVSESLAQQCEQFGSFSGDLEDIVRWYLSPEHRDAPAMGCVSAGLLEEIARAPLSTREAYTVGVSQVAELLIARLDVAEPSTLRAPMLAVIASMAGTLQLARAVADSRLSDEVLEFGIQATLQTLRQMQGAGRAGVDSSV